MITVMKEYDVNKDAHIITVRWGKKKLPFTVCAQWVKKKINPAMLVFLGNYHNHPELENQFWAIAEELRIIKTEET